MQHGGQVMPAFNGWSSIEISRVVRLWALGYRHGSIALAVRRPVYLLIEMMTHYGIDEDLREKMRRNFLIPDFAKTSAKKEAIWPYVSEQAKKDEARFIAILAQSGKLT